MGTSLGIGIFHVFLDFTEYSVMIHVHLRTEYYVVTILSYSFSVLCYCVGCLGLDPRTETLRCCSVSVSASESAGNAKPKFPLRAAAMAAQRQNSPLPKKEGGGRPRSTKREQPRKPFKAFRGTTKGFHCHQA
jgi:hypothetical protein